MLRKRRTLATVEITNQTGSLCAVATHIMSWLERPSQGERKEGNKKMPGSGTANLAGPA